jgi:MFS transporter, OFA family, oxalate/formate antiporter
MSQAAPIFEEMGKATAVMAAGLVGIVSIGNGLGRVFWAWISDLTTRKTAFFLMYLIEAILFWSYHMIGSISLLAVATFIIVMCYGGGYGVTPAFAADYFGARNVGPIFGFMLFPWVLAAGLGPILFAYLRQSSGAYNQGLYLIAGIITVSLILPVVVSPPHARTRGKESTLTPGLGVATITRDPAKS